MSALRQTLAAPVLSPAELTFLRTVADDSEDAPWMVMNDSQWRGASGLFWSLEAYAQAHPVPWYPGGLLPLTYTVPGLSDRKTVAPDVFAAYVPVRGRSSLAVDEEGMPPFVLEVVSGSSVKRDLEEKRDIYRLLGARECVIARLDLAAPRLEGYRHVATGTWDAWVPDAQGRLWSDVLGLWLFLREDDVRAMRPDGGVLRTLREAEEEVVRLRAALEGLTQAGDERRTWTGNSLTANS